MIRGFNISMRIALVARSTKHLSICRSKRGELEPWYHILRILTCLSMNFVLKSWSMGNTDKAMLAALGEKFR